jgi:hypothetical protein
VAQGSVFRGQGSKVRWSGVMVCGTRHLRPNYGPQNFSYFPSSLDSGTRRQPFHGLSRCWLQEGRRQVGQGIGTPHVLSGFCPSHCRPALFDSKLPQVLDSFVQHFVFPSYFVFKCEPLLTGLHTRFSLNLSKNENHPWLLGTKGRHRVC